MTSTVSEGGSDALAAGPRVVRLPLMPFALALYLPPAAYLDHLAFICSGPDHWNCSRSARWTFWCVTFEQIWHAVSMTWVGRLVVVVYVVGSAWSLCLSLLRLLGLA